jgi:XRE family aerobic/anaerobic benzoate catabolism transcriptional regulator
MMVEEKGQLLARLGGRVRNLRAVKGLTRRVLAGQSGVSERFIAEVESGRANISIGKLAEIASALNTPLSTLFEDTSPTAQKSFVALLGLRGAGKSTVGKMLATKLRIPFFELDRLVELEAGMSLSEIFAIHGEGYFRGLEREAVRRLFKEQRAGVIAVGGGVVDSPDTLRLLREHARTIWLKATPEEHWERVVAQGDLRPIQNRPHAMAELKRRLREREPVYAQADFTCSTSERSVSSVVTDIDRRL